MGTDIRERPTIDHKDVLQLNFIRQPNRFVFRRYYRQGLRSHVMEVLNSNEVSVETEGILREGTRWFPKAIPIKMLRIFRSRFSSWTEAFEDIKRFQIVKSYLTTDYIATSEEFIVEYTENNAHRVILCGLQEFVNGQVLDPWGLAGHCLSECINPCLLIKSSEISKDLWEEQIHHHTGLFVNRIRRMILEAHLVPDLAGVGNLLLTPQGTLKLVDINNICPVLFGEPPSLDERGYPTCDKSIEALCRIETHLLEKPFNPSDPIYRHFLTAGRMAAVSEMGKTFHRAISSIRSAADPIRCEQKTGNCFSIKNLP